MAYDLIKERREALEAGERALNSLNAAKADLDSARNWGIFDMLGGGFITSMIKRSKMEDAQEDMMQAKRDLKRFSLELNDISGYYNLSIETQDFLSFADWFFDSFLVDFMVQERINKSREQVNRAIDQVEKVMTDLKNMHV